MLPRLRKIPAFFQAHSLSPDENRKVYHRKHVVVQAGGSFMRQTEGDIPRISIILGTERINRDHCNLHIEHGAAQQRELQLAVNRQDGYGATSRERRQFGHWTVSR